MKMIEVDQVLVSEELIKEEFVCNLNHCKGACCIEGDSGAPLEEEELSILAEIYPAIAPYMTDKGIAAVAKYGTAVKDFEGDWTTPCVNGNQECAYVNWENGITKCAIEKAYQDGAIHWKKPISCHLYPIRITAYPEFDALYYDRWHICSGACSYGKMLQVPVYKFLKDPLSRKYGENWYKKLEEVIENL